MTIIVATQNYTYKKKEYETGRLYDVSDAVASALTGDKKAKKVRGADIQPKKTVVRNRVPKVQNRDPVSDV